MSGDVHTLFAGNSEAINCPPYVDGDNSQLRYMIVNAGYVPTKADLDAYRGFTVRKHIAGELLTIHADREAWLREQYALLETRS